MGRVTELETIESRLWDALMTERLVDLSQFHKAGFADEVPLFSRQSDIDFLSEYSAEEANDILLTFALKFLGSVIAYKSHRAPYFAAITAWDFSEGDQVLPYLFVWSGGARDVLELRKKLILTRVTTAFGKRVQRLVPKKTARDGYRVLEDTLTEPGETRVFISLAHPPYPAFLTLNGFQKKLPRPT